MTRKLINYGFFDSFTIFRLANIYSSKSYGKIVEKLAKSNLIISSEKINDKEGFIEFNGPFRELCHKRFDLYNESIKEKKAQPVEIRGDFSQAKEGQTTNICSISNKGNINLESNIIDKFVTVQEKELYRIEYLYNYEKEYTGFFSHDFKNVFLCYPCKAHKGDKVLYISFFLMVYKNGLAILNSKINIDGENVDELSENIYDTPLDNVFLPEFLFSQNKSNNYKKKSRCNSLREVENVYKKYLDDMFNIENFVMPFNLFTLIDYKNRPREDFTETTDLFNQSIYNLLCAPVNSFTAKSKETVQSFVQSKYFETSYFHRYYGNNSRIVAVYTKQVIDELESINFNENNGKLEDLDVLYLTSLTGVINVVESLLFKKFINDNYILLNLNTRTSMGKLLKSKIKRKNDSLLELKSYYFTYESLTKLQEFMHNKCEGFTGSAIANQWFEEIEDIIKFKRERLSSTLSIMGPIFSIILSLILSFPTIKQITKEIGVEQKSLLIYIIFNTSFILLLFLVFFEQLKESLMHILAAIGRSALLLHTKSRNLLRLFIKKNK